MKSRLPPIALIDADVLIALCDGGILYRLFSLPFKTWTTDFVAEECHSVRIKDITSKGLKINRLTGK